ncbi:MAG: hypothetical protein H6574_11465 [Lewinellaceae bacterium]|nr:hypothetical protein [Saprospiraceae bacterium]MCB9314917.1 hypothetical protein [Lewinellaceae bacterium]MCB9331693.1 hypothetical protein [Lewinellaceae bacterium]
MTIEKIKNDLHRMVVETNDPALLEHIAMLFAQLREERKWATEISEREKILIEKGRQDVLAGKVVSRETIRKDAAEILSPKKP